MFYLVFNYQCRAFKFEIDLIFINDKFLGNSVKMSPNYSQNIIFIKISTG